MMTEEDFRALAASVDRSRSWEAGDERGALNFLTPSTITAALREVRGGEIVSCADRRLASQPTIEAAGTGTAGWLAVNETISFEQHGPHSMTHFDALGHFFYEGRGHDDSGAQIVSRDGVCKLDVGAAAAGIVGRGVLLDLPAIVGAPFLAPSDWVGLGAARDWLRATGTSPTAGDILFVRTGRPRAPTPERDAFPRVGGLGLDCCRWVHDTRFSLIVCDAGMDVPDSPTPLVENVPTPWHVLALTRMGISLVDFADLEQLADACAAAARYSFLAVVSVFPFAGSTGCPVNPLAVL
jgi:kynurenine formamidase